MRKSKVETVRTRQRIVKAAGAEFAANGISEAALVRVMSAAGLTHGVCFQGSTRPGSVQQHSSVARCQPGIAQQRKAPRAGACTPCGSLCVAHSS